MVRNAVERSARSALPTAPVLQDDERSPRSLHRLLTPLPHWTALHKKLSERHLKRSHYLALKHDLASYTTVAEVDDLLATIHDHEDAEATLIRSILTDNLQHQHAH
jgi:hypothetical protein